MSKMTLAHEAAAACRKYREMDHAMVPSKEKALHDVILGAVSDYLGTVHRTRFNLGKDSIEWFDGELHIFDLCGLSLSDIAALEKLREIYEKGNIVTRAEMRGMLHLLEDGLTNGYIVESAETLAWIYDQFAK